MRRTRKSWSIGHHCNSEYMGQNDRNDAIGMVNWHWSDPCDPVGVGKATEERRRRKRKRKSYIGHHSNNNCMERNDLK